MIPKVGWLGGWVGGWSVQTHFRAHSGSVESVSQSRVWQQQFTVRFGAVGCYLGSQTLTVRTQNLVLALGQNKGPLVRKEV